MSIFRVYVDGQLFYHPNLSQLAITQAQVQEDAENIDSLTLSAPFNHPYLDVIKPMASTILCKKDDDIVFEGRALDDGSDFYNTHTWTCESCLAYLKDTLQPPYSYQGTLKGLLELFLAEHNKTVEAKKQFTLGTVTVTDTNDYIAYSNSDYSVTMDAIKDKLIDTHGGYLSIRYEGDEKYLDYLADFTDRSLQTVEFGKNLTDVTITRDHTDRVTALIPFGAKKTVEDEEGKVTELDDRIDITEVNHGINYVYDETAVQEAGWIWATEVWEDVSKPLNLLKKAQARVAELSQGITGMELTIVDESDTGADIGDIRARMYVRCISKPHGIDRTYLCLSRIRDYLDPSGNTITIGATGVKLTAQGAKQAGAILSMESDLLGQTEKIEEITGELSAVEDLKNVADVLTKEVTQTSAELTKTADQISGTVELLKTKADGTSLEELERQVSHVEQDADGLQVTVSSVSASVDQQAQDLLDYKTQTSIYLRFTEKGLSIGKQDAGDDSPYAIVIDNEKMSFQQNGMEIAYIQYNKMHINAIEAMDKLSVGAAADGGYFDFISTPQGMGIKWRNV